jgi:hypothetical protein
VLLSFGAGSYVELDASTTGDADLLYVYFGVAAAGGSWLIDIATGSGPETVIIPNILYESTGTTASLDNAVAVFP